MGVDRSGREWRKRKQQELSRKGGGAARFKQGLGFEEEESSRAGSGSGKFVRASTSRENEKEESERKTQIQNIQHKLKKKYREDRSRDTRTRTGSSSDHSRDRSRSRDKEKGKQYPAYSTLTPAERVKAKMKLQLSQTAENDTKMGSGLQWERFDFNKDAPVDDAEIEVADDDAALVKQIGKTFRFTSLEEKKDDEIKNAHDNAMFGVPAPNPSYTSESEDGRKIENENKETNDADPANNLINEKVLQKQQGTWRDRARRNVG